MRIKVKRFTDKQAIQIATEYLTTSITLKEVREKYGLGGDATIYRWIRKFGLSKPDEETIKINQIMEAERAKRTQTPEYDKEKEELRKQLEFERLKVKALDKMIEIAERDFSISIKKNFGSKQ